MENTTEGDLGTFICLGYSQCGKTSTIATISNSQVGPIGTGNGKSCTMTSHFHEINSNLLNSEIQLIDLPGFFDSDFRISDEEIQHLIRMQVSQSLGQSRTIKGFLIFESVQSEVMTLLNCLELLINVCGPEAINSVIVVITKTDLNKCFPDRIDAITHACKQQGLNYVRWSNRLNLLNENEKKAQVELMKYALGNLKPYNSEWISALKDSIYEIAQRLAIQQPPPTNSDIFKKAQELADESPAIPVTKIKSAIVLLNKQKQVNVRRRHGKVNELVLLKWTDEEVKTDSFTEYEKLPYSAFMDVAAELCGPKPVDYFLEEAGNIKKEEIKTLLVNNFNNNWL